MNNFFSPKGVASGYAKPPTPEAQWVETDSIYNLSPVLMKYILRHGGALRIAEHLVMQYISPLTGLLFWRGALCYQYFVPNGTMI